MEEFANVGTSSSLSMEIHEIVGAGSAGVAIWMQEISSKPRPCSWRAQLVSATTLNEYRIVEKMQP